MIFEKKNWLIKTKIPITTNIGCDRTIPELQNNENNFEKNFDRGGCRHPILAVFLQKKFSRVLILVSRLFLDKNNLNGNPGFRWAFSAQ